MTPEEDRPPVNAVELAVCSAVAPLLEAAGVPDPGGQAPQVLGYLRRFGFAVSFRGDPVDAATADRYLAMALDITIVQGHGGPRTCAAGTRDAAALRRRLDPVGLHLARIRTGVALMALLSHPPNPGTPSPARVGPSRSPVTAVLRWPATTSTCLSRSLSRKGHCDEP